jgi:hypothetical protein
MFIAYPMGGRSEVIEPRARHSRQLLREAQDRGEIRPGADLDAAMELLVGSLFARALTGGHSPRPWPECAVDTLLDGLRPHLRGSRCRR